MLTRFVRIQLADLHDRRDHRRDRDGPLLHPGADPAGHRPDDGDAGAAGHRRPVPVFQRDLPRGAGRQGHRGGVDADRRESHAVA